jgi:hypothetical protein
MSNVEKLDDHRPLEELCYITLYRNHAGNLVANVVGAEDALFELTDGMEVAERLEWCADAITSGVSMMREQADEMRQERVAKWVNAPGLNPG